MAGMDRQKMKMARLRARSAKPKRTPPREQVRTAPYRTEHRQRFDALPADRQAALLNPAEAEFAARGFEGASLNRILEKAGLSKGQAYYYVKDKGELYLLVAERAFAKIGAGVGPLPAAASADEYWIAIGRFFRRLSAVLGRGTKLGKLVRAIYPTSAAANAALEPLLARLHDRLEDHVRLGQSMGAVRADLPPDFLAAGALGFLTRIDRWFAVNKSGLTDNEALRLNDAVTQMCRAMASAVRDGELSLDQNRLRETAHDSRLRKGVMP
jgi:AcrR family transcriptional regulator